MNNNVNEKVPPPPLAFGSSSSSSLERRPQLQCSSGCESGWTLYLDHSNNTATPKYFSHENNRRMIPSAGDEEHEDGFYYYSDEEEDLSMVSDASSGPPHFDHDLDLDIIDDVELFCYEGGARKAKSIKLTHHHCSDKSHDFTHALDFDDTASSPFLFTSKKNEDICNTVDRGSSLESMIVDYSSQGFSATHFQGRSNTNNFQERYGFLHHESPYSTEQLNFS